MSEKNIKNQKVVVFDGICNLCNGSVQFILKWEKSPRFQFASIQSEGGKELLKWCGLPMGYREAIVMIDNGKIYLGSTAALKIGQDLKFPWSVLSSIGLLFPKFLRDWVYRQIAQHRYQWFGKTDRCMVPTQGLRSRFR